MSKRISTAVDGINPSATIVIANKAKQMVNEGINVISLATGEPDFDTPSVLKESGIKAIKNNFTRYTPVQGIAELREAVCQKFKRDNDIEYTPDQVIITNGAKQALFNAFYTLCEKGDKVLLPTPCYVSFLEQIRLASAEPVFIPTEAQENFRLSPEILKDYYQSGMKCLLLNNPNNPSGAISTIADLEKIAEFIVSKDMWVITDEVYESIYFENKPISLASLGKEIAARTITVNAVSKTYCMTGWRLGFAAGPKDIISAMIKFQSHVTGNVNTITQKVSVDALIKDYTFIEEMRLEYEKRKIYMVQKLNEIEGIFCNNPDGTFYVFPDVRALVGKSFNDKKLKNEIDICEFLLDNGKIATVPGTAFQYPGFIRLTFATSMENINEGLKRFKAAVELLK